MTHFLFPPYQDFCEQEIYMVSFLSDFRKFCICFVYIYLFRIYRLTLNQYRKIRKFSFEISLYIKIIYIKHIMNNIIFKFLLIFVLFSIIPTLPNFNDFVS